MSNFSSSSSQFSNILQYTIMWIISLACKFADTSACQWEWSRRSKIKLVINQDCSLMDTPNNWDGWYFERRKRSICVAKIHLAKDKVISILVFLRNLVILFFNNCDYWIEKFWPTIERFDTKPCLSKRRQIKSEYKKWIAQVSPEIWQNHTKEWTEMQDSCKGPKVSILGVGTQVLLEYLLGIQNV